MTGDSWADYLQKHILDPLDMHDTHPIPSEDDPQLAVGYRMLNADYQRLPDKPGISVDLYFELPYTTTAIIFNT